MEDSVFTKIIRGEIPCHKVYEDDKAIAFLDINPFTPGHTLVVPKLQVDSLWDLDDSLYRHVMEITKKVAQKQQKVLNPARVGMALMGFDVPHAHVHVIPLQKGFVQTTIDFSTRPEQELDHAALAAMAEKLRF